ncbi:MAG: hypothetical protein WKI04_09860 [Ferruginibacter sp.]
MIIISLYAGNRIQSGDSKNEQFIKIIINLWTMKNAGNILLIYFIIIFASCEKAGGDSDCQPASTFEITTNSPVIEGWPLTLSTST